MPLTEAQAINALTVLARLAQREQDVEQWIYDAISADPETMIVPAIRVAIETGTPVGEVLAMVLYDAEVPLEVLVKARGEIPAHTIELGQAAVAIGEKLGDNTFIHAERLLESGQVDDALVAACQLPGSSEDLRVLSACLVAADEHLAAIEVASRRVKLAAPDELGYAWYGLATRYYQAGDLERALPAVDTALSCLSNGASDSLATAQAASLRAAILESLGRGPEGLPMALEAVRTLRELAAEEPDAHQPAYANAILVLMDCLRGLDDEENKVPEVDRTEIVEVMSRSLVWAVCRLTLDAAWRGDVNRLRSLTQLLISVLRDWADIVKVANMLVTQGLSLLASERRTESDAVLSAAEGALSLLVPGSTSGKKIDSHVRITLERTLVARSRWQEKSDPKSAVKTARQATRVAASGGDKHEYAFTSNSLAVRLYRTGRVAKAFQAQLECVRADMRIYDSEFADQVYMTAAWMRNLFDFAEEAGKADSVDDEILEFGRELISEFPGHRGAGQVLEHFARIGFSVVMLYGRHGDPERAAATFHALGQLGERYPEHHVMRTTRVMSAWNVVRSALRAGRPDLAEPVLIDVAALAASAPDDLTARAERDACADALRNYLS